MRIDRFLSQNRIIELKNRDFASALGELLDVALPAGTPTVMRENLKKTLIERQASMPTSVGGNYITVPNVCTMIDSQFIFAVGRMPPPETCDSGTASAPGTEESPRVIFLVLASSKTRMYHQVLSEVAHALAEPEFLERIRVAESLKDFRAEITKLLKGVAKQAQDHESGMNRLIGKAAHKIAQRSKCDVLMLFADTFKSPPLLERFAYPTYKTVVVSTENYDFHSDAGEKPEVITVRSFGNHRMSQLRAAMFVGLMRGIIKPDSTQTRKRIGKFYN